MAGDDAPLAILGPTGYTGRLVLERAREAGFRVRLVGRRRQALEGLAQEREDVRVADARDESALRSAFDGAFAVVSLAGPFLANGTAPVAAAVGAGAHYLDSSGEQAFARRVYEELGPSAAKAGVALLTSFGFDYVPGDLVARLAATGLEEPLDEVLVAYSVDRLATSAGTRSTAGALLGHPQVAWEGGALIASRFGETTRSFRFPTGARTAVEWWGTEPLTVPRHTKVGRVRSYVRAPRAAALAGPLARLAAPLVRLSGRVGTGPPERRRARATFAVVAEARRGDDTREAALVGSDVYGLTALLLIRAVEALRAGEVRRAGALAPAEAFDPRTFVERLSPLMRHAGPREES